MSHELNHAIDRVISILDMAKQTGSLGEVCRLLTRAYDRMSDLDFLLDDALAREARAQKDEDGLEALE